MEEKLAMGDCADQFERSFDMLDQYHALQIIFVAVLLPVAFDGKMDSLYPTLTEQTLEAIQKCMVQSPAPWPEEWKKEYIETISKEVELHRDVSYYSLRLEILYWGFADCWESLPKKNDRPLFEVYRCRIRWYVEHLMGTEFPSENERQTLRDQFTEIWNYASSSLLTQFAFLDPNMVQKAKNEDLRKCYRKINAPLMPVYMHSMSEEHVAQIKQGWDRLRYARVDICRRLKGGSMISTEGDVPPTNMERDYELSQKSLSQLIGLIWKIVPQRPDYYIASIENQRKVMGERVRSKRLAWDDQKRLEKEHSRQLLQIEHISFLLATLLEMPQCVSNLASVQPSEHILVERQDKIMKGGGAYEVKINSPKSRKHVEITK